MARFFSFALLFLALVSVGLANVRPKPVKKEYQLAITGDGCGVQNMNLICSTGIVAAGNMVKSPLLKSQVSSGGKDSVYIKLAEITKAVLTGASRN